MAIDEFKSALEIDDNFHEASYWVIAFDMLKIIIVCYTDANILVSKRIS